MKLKNIIILSSLVLMACGGATEEEIGGEMVGMARRLMNEKNYTAARDTIISLRQNHPTAIEARKRAILLLDSVELFATRDSLRITQDSIDRQRLLMKEEFYVRKIQFDENNK